LRGSGDALERFVEGRRVLEADVALRDRPGREMHVRVVESRQDAAAAEVDAVGRGEGSLVRADAAGDPVAGDGHGPRDGQSRVERPGGSIFEDHRRESCLPDGEEEPCSTT
jgi:hypothetical protein